jgi:hypothetical protein
MFAKLFDDISVRSLANAIGFSALTLGFLFFLPFEPLMFQMWGYTFSYMQWFSYAVVISIVFGVSFAFNEFTNRAYLFKGQNHLLICFVLLSFTTLLAPQTYPYVVSLPLGLLFFLKLSGLFSNKNTRFISFDAGLLAGFFSLVYPPALLLIPIQIVLTLFLGKLGPRQLIIIILGVCAGVSFPAFVGSWFGSNLLSPWWQGILSINFSISAYQHLSYGTLIPLALAIFIAFFNLPLLINKANMQQKAAYTFWYLGMLLCLLPLLVLNHKPLFMGFLIFPLAWVFSKVLSENSNKWLRDSIYLLLFGAAAWQVFTVWP